MNKNNKKLINLSDRTDKTYFGKCIICEEPIFDYSCFHAKNKPICDSCITAIRR